MNETFHFQKFQQNFTLCKTLFRYTIEIIGGLYVFTCMAKPTREGILKIKGLQQGGS